MFKGFRKNTSPQDKIKSGILPSPRESQGMLINFEKDSTRDPEFRCIAGICARQELLEHLCDEIEADAPKVCAIAFVTLFDLPNPGMTEDDRRVFAQFRQIARDRVFQVWSQHRLGGSTDVNL